MPPGNFDVRTWNSSESFRPRSNKTDFFYSSSEILSSRSSKATVMVEEPGEGPMMSITASMTMKGASIPQSSIVLARTLWPRQC